MTDLRERVLDVLDERGPMKKKELERATFDGDAYCPHCGKRTDEFNRHQAELRGAVQDLIYDSQVVTTPERRFDTP